MRADYGRSVTANTVDTHHVGFVQIHKYGGRVEAIEVVAEQESNSDAEFNVLLAGSALFSATQSVAAADTPEVLVPDQNEYASGASMAVELDVTASAANADQLHVDVLLESDE